MYANIVVTILHIIHILFFYSLFIYLFNFIFLFKTHLSSVGLAIPHRKYITSPLRVQQINAI
jgi:hypothetical protein